MNIRAKIMIDSDVFLLSDEQGKIFLPSIEEKDFLESKKLVPDLQRWANHSEYLDEIEGYYMGLTTAGLDAQLVPVSISGFISWIKHASRKPTLRNLTEFARIVAIGRNNSKKNSDVAFKAKNGTKALVHLRSGANETTVVVSRDLYDNWRRLASSLRSERNSFTAKAYFRLLLESWIEAP